MKKLVSLFLGLSSFVMFGSFASAQPNIGQSVVNAYNDFFEPILRALFGGTSWGNLYLFERFLLFIILVSLIYVAIGRIELFKEQRAVKWVISIIVPLLGMRFVDYSWLNAVLLQYGLLAIVLTSILPFIIYFYFLINIFPGDNNAFVRKMGWLLFAMVYLGLWVNASNDTQSSIFYWTMIASFVFIFLDGYIGRYLQKRDEEKGKRSRYYQYIADIDGYIRNIQNSSLSSEAKREEINRLEKDRKEWLRKV